MTDAEMHRLRMLAGCDQMAALVTRPELAEPLRRLATAWPDRLQRAQVMELLGIEAAEQLVCLALNLAAYLTQVDAMATVLRELGLTTPVGGR